MVAVNRDQPSDKPGTAAERSGSSTPAATATSSEAGSEDGTCSKKEEQSVEEKEKQQVKQKAIQRWHRFTCRDYYQCLLKCTRVQCSLL